VSEHCLKCGASVETIVLATGEPVVVDAPVTAIVVREHGACRSSVWPLHSESCKPQPMGKRAGEGI
jgi:hypothetical protein